MSAASDVYFQSTASYNTFYLACPLTWNFSRVVKDKDISTEKKSYSNSNKKIKLFTSSCFLLDNVVKMAKLSKLSELTKYYLVTYIL